MKVKTLANREEVLVPHEELLGRAQSACHLERSAAKSKDPVFAS